MRIITFIKKNEKWILWTLLIPLVILSLSKAYYKSNDFHTYYRTALRIINGDFTIYTLADGQGPFWYPPFFAYVFSISGLFSLKAAQILWGLINLCFTAGIVIQLRALLFPQKDDSERFWFLLLVSSLYPLLSNFQTGNIHIMLLFLMLLFFRYFKAEKFLLSSVFLSVAILFKLTPAILYPYIIFRAKWKPSILVPLTAAFLILLPGLFIGFEKNLSLYEKFIDFIPLYDQAVDLSRETIQSLVALSLRYFSHVRDGLQQVNILSLKRETAILISRILSIIVVIPAAVLFCANYRKPFEGKRAIEFSIILAALTLLTPSAFIHTLVFLTPAYAVILLYFFRGNKNTALHYLTISGWALITFSPDIFWGKRLNDFFECLSIPTIGILMVFVAVNYLYYLQSKNSGALKHPVMSP